MKISTLRSTERQETFWPAPIRSMAQTRNHCGEFAEELSAIVLGAERCKTDGTADYCPDLRRGESQFIECKSVGRNGSAIIYKGRREKDRWFNFGNRDLYYVFWRHRLSIDGIKDVDELRRQWAETVTEGVLIDFGTVDRLLEARPLRMLNKHYSRADKPLGYGCRSKGYGDGWSVPYAILRDACMATFSIPPVSIRGVSVGPIALHTFDSMRFLLREQ